MLCQFIFKNFKSYKDETILDLQAVSKYGFENSLLKNDSESKSFLPVSVIYGPNAGGKSNVLEALKSVINIVTKPIAFLRNSITMSTPVNCVPFMLDDTSRNEPTQFELFFSVGGYEYRYIISTFNGDIVEEYLYRKTIKGKKTATLFERDENGIVLGSSINKASINVEVNSKMPYISFLAVNYNIQAINLAIKWFEGCIIRNYGNPLAELQLIMVENDSFKNKLLQLLNDVGINISDYQFKETSMDKKSYDIIFSHDINGKTYPLSIQQESDGTQKLFNVLPLVIIALTEGKLLIFDELDAKLHPKLLRFIVMLFKNPKINTTNAQLIFTSHDVSTMKSSVYRTDEIWFACKKDDESSDLYSMNELRDTNNSHIKPSSAYDKQYLEGRYGADPYLRNILEWE
jgi:hypothetical protein